MSNSVRWLHLSDIHYMFDPNSERIRQCIKKKLSEYCNTGAGNYVNCIVVTGDFFHQGKANSLNAQGCIRFLQEICYICLYESLRDEWKKHIVFCPGNHDVDRLAIRHDLERKETTYRKDVLENVVLSSPNCMIDLSEKDYAILTEESFWLFNELVCKELGGASLKGNYEYRVFSESPLKDGEHQVIFIGLNTALYAGQLQKQSEIAESLYRAGKNIRDNVQRNHPDYTQSERNYKEYLAFHRALTHGKVDDKGKLCFISKKSQDELKKIIENTRKSNATSFYVFFGHHPISWLSLDAQKNFANFASSLTQSNNIYFCGHEHIPTVHYAEVEFIQSVPFKAVEIEVGGDFADISSWNIPSFSIDTMRFDKNNTAYLSGDIFCWCHYLDNEHIAFADNAVQSHGWQRIQFGKGDEIAFSSNCNYAFSDVPPDHAAYDQFKENDNNRKEIEKTEETKEIEKTEETDKAYYPKFLKF